MTDTQAPKRIVAWPGAYPRYESDDWMNAECRGEAEAGPDADADYGTWYVRADLADARAAAAAQAMREAAAQPSYDMAEAFRKVAQHPDAKANTALDLAVIHKAIADKITALPLPDTAALDRLIAERVREAVEAEREACISIMEELYYCRSCGVRFLERDGHCDEDCAEGHANWNLATGEIKIDFIRARGSKEGQS